MLSFILGFILGIVLIVIVGFVIYKRNMSKLNLNSLDLSKMFDTNLDFNFKDSDFED